MPKFLGFKVEADRIATLKANENHVKAFKKFCEDNSKNEYLDEIHWYDLSIGFFMARGLSVSDSVILALFCRYTAQYWC